MYKQSEYIEMTPDRIQAYIADYQINKLPKLLKLKRYYEGQHDIINRVMTDNSKPNNRVVHGYANYITNTMTAYFMGNPVKYKCEDERTQEELDEIFKYNDEAAENMSVEKDASVYGVGFELVYVDREGKTRFKRLDTIGCIPIYDDTLEEELLYVIRFYFNYDLVELVQTQYTELYSRESIKYYRSVDNGGLEFMGEQIHGFNGYVPISIYKNNEEEMGDFENVISMIDAYDRTVSDSINDMDQFADSYLVLKGIGEADDDTLATMKANRLLLLDDESDAKFLVKDVNDTYSKNIEDRLNDDIYKFSGCVDLTSDITAMSGIAIKYRLLGMENVCAIKESYFKKGLLRRIELISVIEKAMQNPDEIITEVEMQFTRNLPTDNSEFVDIVTKLDGIVSDETLLGLLPFVDDAEAEMERRDKALDIYGEETHEHPEAGTVPISA